MSRPRTVTDAELFDRLATVFRTTGYDGASLKLLSTAAGLHSASLYHRFPQGKTEMATAVLDDVERQFADILAPISTTDDVAEGVREMARRVAAFYADGRLACVLDTMTLGGAPSDVRLRASALARGWIEAMSHAAARAGFDDVEAARRGRDAFVRIEGSLVLSRVLDEPSVFMETLQGLPHLLTEQATSVGVTTPAATRRGTPS
jgi:AcrR family transcriptional regulator